MPTIRGGWNSRQGLRAPVQGLTTSTCVTPRTDLLTYHSPLFVQPSGVSGATPFAGCGAPPSTGINVGPADEMPPIHFPSGEIEAPLNPSGVIARGGLPSRSWT